MAWGEGVPPQPEAGVTSGADSLGKVGREYQQQVSVTRHTGTHHRCTLHGRLGRARMNKLDTAKLSA